MLRGVEVGAPRAAKGEVAQFGSITGTSLPKGLAMPTPLHQIDGLISISEDVLTFSFAEMPRLSMDEVGRAEKRRNMWD